MRVAGWDLAGRCTGWTDCFSSRAEVSVTSWDASSDPTSHLFCSRPAWRMGFYQGFLRRLVSFPSTGGKKNIKERERENSLYNAFFSFSFLSALLVKQPCENIWQLSKSRSLNIGLQLNIFPCIFFSFSPPPQTKLFYVLQIFYQAAMLSHKLQQYLIFWQKQIKEGVKKETFRFCVWGVWILQLKAFEMNEPQTVLC